MKKVNLLTIAAGLCAIGGAAIGFVKEAKNEKEMIEDARETARETAKEEVAKYMAEQTSED